MINTSEGVAVATTKEESGSKVDFRFFEQTARNLKIFFDFFQAIGRTMTELGDGGTSPIYVMAQHLDTVSDSSPFGG